jgi:hypothetical protein
MKDLKGLVQMLTYGNRYGRKGNNRKCTRGRKVEYQEIPNGTKKVNKTLTKGLSLTSKKTIKHYEY